MKKEYFILLSITFVGAYLRFNHLDIKPLWIDEGFYASLLRNDIFKQEYPVWIIDKAFNLYSEFWLRFPIALAGVLTIPAFYWVTKRMDLTFIVALFPIFGFWSMLARPYAFAGLFMVLGWKDWKWNIIGILTTPLAAVGTKFDKKYYKMIVPVLLALFIYFNRSDVGAITYGVRMLYLPLLAGLLWVSKLEESI